MKKIKIKSQSRDYTIYIGFKNLDPLIKFLEENNFKKIMMIFDTNTANFFRSKFFSLERKFDLHTCVIKSGEPSKSWETVNKIASNLLKKNFDRKTILIAVGGGVVGDVCGFTASIYQRGIAYLQYPTTLLAQVDSSVGGKTAINHKLGKNMIGTFYQPSAVFISIGSLKKLPEREFFAGLSEVVKYAFIMDRTFLQYLLKNKRLIFSHKDSSLETIIYKCCKLKSRVVNLDEKETGVRAILNFGHTLGHAIENCLGYRKILHGEAVAIGMLFAAKLSCEYSSLPSSEFELIKKSLFELRLISKESLVLYSKISEKKLLDAMKKDKKNFNGNISFVLLEKIGKANFNNLIEQKDLKKILSQFKKCLNI